MDPLSRARATAKQAEESLKRAKDAERQAWNSRAGGEERSEEGERRRGHFRALANGFANPRSGVIAEARPMAALGIRSQRRRS